MRRTTIAARFLFCALALAFPAVSAFAQPVEGDGDTVQTPGSDTLNPDDAFFNGVAEEEEEQVDGPGFFRERGGFFGGPLIEFTTLKPADLDPLLKGDLIIFGAEGYVLLSGWMLGGAGMSGHLYDLNSEYDRFDYGYGGLLTGYDTRIFYGAFSVRGSLLVGGGGLEMLKKRPDLTPAGGNEILERVREEGFFFLRPGISIGYAPLQFMEFRIGTDYLLPFGGEKVNDLRNLTYGLRLAVGIGD